MSPSLAHGLSPSQVAVLFHQGMCPRSPVYTHHVLVEFEGELDPAALRAAWNVVFARHDALRTRIRWGEDGRPRQFLDRRMELPLTEVDLRDRPMGEFRRTIEQFVAQDRQRGFDFDEGPLHRVALFHTGPDRATISWAWHHLSLDVHSCFRVLDEVVEVYDGLRGLARRDQEEPAKFAEYLRWLAGEDFAQHRVYWRDALRDLPPSPSWPPRDMMCDNGRGAEGDLRARLSLAASLALRDWLVEVGVTLEVAVLGAWALLLGSEGGSSDVVVGLARSGRAGLPFHLRSVVGPLGTTIPIRVRIPADSPVPAWLREIQDQVLIADQFAHASLSRIRRAAGLPPGRHLFDTMVTVSSGCPRDRMDGVGRSLVSRSVELRERREFGLALDVFGDERLGVLLRHDPRLVSVREAEGVMDRFVTFLRLLRSGRARVGDLVGALAPVRDVREGADGAPAQPPAPAAGHVGAPRTPEWTDTEREVARVWARMLRASTLDREDDFFEVGGDSLAALRMTDDLRQLFGVGLPARGIFRRPVLWSYAALVDEMVASAEVEAVR